jgi:tetratricopeptide (TPR) repeat protein
MQSDSQSGWRTFPPLDSLLLAAWCALGLGALGGCGAPTPASHQGAAATSPGPKTTARETVPLYSDGWFDDSGFAIATQFEAPMSDPESLAEVGTARARRTARGIERLTSQLARHRSLTPEDRVHAARIHLMIGGLHMFDGRFDEAKRHFEQARAIHPAEPALFAANVEALLGVASLRQGETENCIACKNESSCIFPLAQEAVHQRPSGSREAIRHFTAYLRQRPDDLGIQWLLNIAYMTLGEYPENVPGELRLPLEPFASRVEVGKFTNIATRVGLNVRGENMAGGCIVDDFNGDGLLDLVTSNSDPGEGAAIYLNRGDGWFEDHTASSGLETQIGAANASQADFDNDGHLDLLLLRGGWESPKRPSLLRGRGDGTFDDVTPSAGLAEPIACQAGAWGDFNNDGWLDLYLVGEFDHSRPRLENRGRLYRNNRNGTFTDIAVGAGVHNDRWGKGAAWGDFDNDGWLDLYVSNNGQPNRLYHNNGNGTFTDVAEAMQVTEPLRSFACWFWDYDNDGWLDLYVCNFGDSLSDVVRSHLGRPTSGERPRLYRNLQGQAFQDVTREVGLDRVLVSMGSNFGDLDNDGFLDIYIGTGRPEYRYVVPNVLFLNLAGTRFEDVTLSSGTGHLQKGHGVGFGDWDRDGDVDLFVQAGGASPGDRAFNLLFQNPGHGRHWLNVKLVGTRTNRAAIGARVRVDLPGDPAGRPPASRHRQIGSGSSYGGNPMATTIGLGDADKIEAIEVFWPVSKTRQVVRDVPIDRFITITEGSDQIEILDAPAINLDD